MGQSRWLHAAPRGSTHRVLHGARREGVSGGPGGRPGVGELDDIPVVFRGWDIWGASNEVREVGGAGREKGEGRQEGEGMEGKGNKLLSMIGRE